MLVSTGHHHPSVDNRLVTAAALAETARYSDGLFCRLSSGIFQGSQQVVPERQDSAVVRAAVEPCSVADRRHDDRPASA